MRVIFTGPTGIDKEVLINHLAQRICSEYGYSPAIDSKVMDNFIARYSVESLLGEGLVAFTDWLDLPPKEQVDWWKNGFGNLRARIRRENPANIFLSMHSTFFRSGRFFSPLDWSELRKFKPDLFITLIDDIYDVWWRIQKRGIEFEPGGALRLRELLMWRSIEVMMVDALATNLNPKHSIPHYIVAIKHPIDMVNKLLLHPEIMRIYASYPISQTRNSSHKRQEVDENRKRLHEEFVVFDPVTIDEKMLAFALFDWKDWDVNSKHAPKPKTISIKRHERWPIPSPAFQTELLSDILEYPETISGIDPREIEEIIEAIPGWLERGIDIDDHIVWRDYRLVDQANCLAVYRPLYEKQLAGGVSAEISYAIATRTRPYIYYLPDADGSVSMFQRRGAVLATSPEEFLRLLKQHQNQLQKDSIYRSHEGVFNPIQTK